MQISYKNDNKIADKKLKDLVEEYVNNISRDKKNILIIPPDKTRKHSGAGKITNLLFHKLKDNKNVKIMPALGTHDPMTVEEKEDMFGENISQEYFLVHRWREDTVKIGEVPAEFISEISNSVYKDEVVVNINQKIMNRNRFDLIISIGQVLPHEVVGMANYTKNIVVGCGGEEIINKSHFLGAIYGIEKLLGKDHSPVRKLYDYIENKFLKDVPLNYIFTVNKSEINEENETADIVGFFAANEDIRDIFEEAVELSQKVNITYLEEPVEKFVVYLDPSEFTSTWLGNKAIYRTRMAVADNGEIIIIAPGLKQIGEDDRFDQLIKKYGYQDRDEILRLVKSEEELKNNLAVAAHLIHGSTEGRFTVKYASRSISPKIIEKVNYEFVPLERIESKYPLEDLARGYNKRQGEEFYFIENPATGLWVCENKFN